MLSVESILVPNRLSSEMQTFNETQGEKEEKLKHSVNMNLLDNQKKKDKY